MVEMPTRTKVESWKSNHLAGAADAWTRQAHTVEDIYGSAQQAVTEPTWHGSAADSAHDWMFSDIVRVRTAMEVLRKAAGIAKNGVELLAGLKRSGSLTIISSRGRRLPFMALAAAAYLPLALCTSCIATAQPKKDFPDLSAFATVDWQQFDSGGSPARGYLVRFSTPDGTTRCSILNGLTASCVGNIAGIPDPAPDYSRDKDTFGGNDSGSCAGVLFGGDSQYSFRRNGGGCPPFADAKTLQAGQKLVKYQITCAVGDGNLTACINTATNHGFVLQPSGSWTF
jgi:predicted small integral membrane protein